VGQILEEPLEINTRLAAAGNNSHAVAPRRNHIQGK
jgi:hypothetical protein